jgi:2-keto-4-pentenoate hydratase/2-oxohepta-3-ene-1,7-dioic acid hydratase in catechol pathway
MKIARYSVGGRCYSGVVLEDGLVSFEAMDLAYASVEGLIAGGAGALSALKRKAKDRKPEHAFKDVILKAPLARPGKYLAIGLNYAKHIAEASALAPLQKPKHQIWFNKQTTCINDPYGDLDPGVSTQLDYEVELGVVIGKTAKGVKAAEALDYVFGYTVANDVTARDWQGHSATWTMGKSFDSHGPIGPWIVTADEIPDPQSLDLFCKVNGELRQHGNTADMIATVAQQIEYLSIAFTLEPGDLLATGTPEGVGMAMKPPTYLRSGDVVRCEIAGIGVIENRVK